MIEDYLKPTVYTQEMHLDLRQFHTGKQLKTNLTFALMELTEKLQENGCRLIGHIKGIIEFMETGSALFFSITNFKQKPFFLGKTGDGDKEALLTVNVIIYGISEEVVREIATKCLHQRIILEPVRTKTNLSKEKERV